MIYLDHAATTPLDAGVLESMLPYLKEKFYNPSSSYRSSVRLHSEIAEARSVIASAIGAGETEIIFTSGGTESDNLAIKGVARAYKNKGRHIITTKIEHPAVLNTCRHLEKEGFEVSYVNVDKKGLVDLSEIRRLMRPDTILVSVMYANNETGVIEPVGEIGGLCRERGVLFHTDAVQTFGHIPVNVNDINADLLSVSGHKIYGPKGTGFLYVRGKTKLDRILDGGEQEYEIRPGTENVAGIIGLSKASELAISELSDRMHKEKILSDILKERILSEIAGVHINGAEDNHLPGTLNFTFDKIQGETLLIQLDMNGICASTGSACTQGNGEPSHVLKAMGLSDEEASGSLRLTVGYQNTEEEINKAADIIRDSVEYLRSMRLL